MASDNLRITSSGKAENLVVSVALCLSPLLGGEDVILI